MTTTITENTIAPGVGTLTALRARAAQSGAEFDEARRTTIDQARLLRGFLPHLPNVHPTHLTTLIPTVFIRYVDQIPLPGLSFWGNGRWNIHIRAVEPEDIQVFTVLRELKHIIDHPLKRQPNRLDDAEWEALADCFASQVLAVEPDAVGTSNERRNAYE
jgi:hypothetical protein